MGTEALRWWKQLLEQLQQAAIEASSAAAGGTAAGPSWQPSNLEDIYIWHHQLPGWLAGQTPKGFMEETCGIQGTSCICQALRGVVHACLAHL